MRDAFRIVLCACAAVAACRESAFEPVVEPDPDIRAYVTGAAASALDQSGHFQFPSTAGHQPDNVPIVGAQRARELAVAFTQSYGPSFLPFWERDRGTQIDFASLTASIRVYPADSPFGAVPDEGCHPAFIRMFGPYYLLTLESDDTPVVRLAVSAQTTEFDVANDGSLIEPPSTGQDFVHEGIPSRSGTIVSPEQAVALAARATDARIVEVPRLTLRRSSVYSPTTALWEVQLDRPANVVTGDARTQLATLFVGPDALFYAPDVTQPDAVTFTCTTIDENGAPNGQASVVVPILAARPVDFKRIAVKR